jgi:hypothetical protein
MMLWTAAPWGIGVLSWAALKREKFKEVRPLPDSGRDDRELKF